MFFCEKAALIITKLQLIGAEPEILTVNSLDIFFFFPPLALKMRRQGVAKQAFFSRGFMKQTNKTSLQEMTQGHAFENLRVGKAC